MAVQIFFCKNGKYFSESPDAAKAVFFENRVAADEPQIPPHGLHDHESVKEIAVMMREVTHRRRIVEFHRKQLKSVFFDEPGQIAAEVVWQAQLAQCHFDASLTHVAMLMKQSDGLPVINDFAAGLKSLRPSKNPIHPFVSTRQFTCIL